MNERNQILDALRESIDDNERLQSLENICNEMFGVYDEGSAAAVTDLLESRIGDLRTRFEEAHAGLLDRMGL